MAQQQQFTPAVLGPDLQQKQNELSRRSMYAQMLMQQGAQMPQGQVVSGHYVAPSWTQQLASALSGALGTKLAMDLPKQEQDLSTLQNQRLAQAMLGGQGGAQGGQPAIGSLPGRSPEQSLAIAQSIGLPAYMKMLGEQGNQRPIAVAPGGTLVDPNTRQPLFTAAQNGVQTVYGPNGPQAQAVPGFAAANAAVAGAETAAQEQARAALDLVDVPDGKGGTIKMPRAQAVQALGAQGGAPGQSGQLGQALSPQVTEARQGLSKVDSQVTGMIRSIDQALEHPGKAFSVGMGSMLPTIPGTAQADFRALQAQLQGQAFLQAFESLKGGGQITEVEGQKAEAAIARLNSAQSQEAYDAALRELRGTLEQARKRAYSSAQMEMPQAAPAAPSGGDFSSLWGG